MKDWFNKWRKEVAVLTTAVVVVSLGAFAAGPNVNQFAAAEETVNVPRAELEAVIAQMQGWLDVTTTTTGPTTTASPTTTAAPTTTASPTTTLAPTTTAQTFDCSAIVSMSQGRNIYEAAPGLEIQTSTQWMLLFQGGARLVTFANNATWDNLDERDRCGTNEEVDRILFIFDPGNVSVATMNDQLNSVRGIVDARFPNAALYVSLLVGAEGHVVCTGNGATASTTHANRIAAVIVQPDAGPDLDIPCSGFADRLGHLNAGGATNAQGQVGGFFSAPPPTTTTTAPTTTTTTGTTTTTAPPTPSGDFFQIRLRNTDLGNVAGFWWDANYFRTLPFYPQSGWTDGDRNAYKCAYMFLMVGGEPVARVTFTAVPGAASYAFVNDFNMAEGIRFYDGSLAPPGAPIELHDCPPPAQDYAPYTGPDERPLITFNTSTGDLIERRNYAATVAGSDKPGANEEVVFHQTESSPSRVTVVAYVNDLPVIVVYYDSITPDVVVLSDLP